MSQKRYICRKSDSLNTNIVSFLTNFKTIENFLHGSGIKLACLYGHSENVWVLSPPVTTIHQGFSSPLITDGIHIYALELQNSGPSVPVLGPELVMDVFEAVTEQASAIGLAL